MIENDIFKALADPTRRAIFEKLAPGGMNASALRVGMDISQSAMSQHLAVLRKAGLVREERQGRFVNYEVDPDGLALIAGWLSKYRAYWPARVDALKALLRTWINERHPAQDTQDEQADALVLEYTLDAPPSQVWRAVSIPRCASSGYPMRSFPTPIPSRSRTRKKSATACATTRRRSWKAWSPSRSSRTARAARASGSSMSWPTRAWNAASGRPPTTARPG